jgi:hypothetical protein
MSAPATEHKSESPTKKDQFDVLLESLARHYTGFIDFAFKHGSFVFIILGWYVTLSTRQSQFALPERVLLTIAMFSLTTLHAIWAWRWYRKSAHAYKQLIDLAFLPDKYFWNERIHPFLACSIVFFHALISLLICFLIWWKL